MLLLRLCLKKIKMRFSKLNQLDLDLIKLTYEKEEYRSVAQGKLARYFGVEKRTIRNWVKKMCLTDINVSGKNPKIMIYDIETSRAEFKSFWTGKQFLGHKSMTKEPAIISISWKYIGDDKIHALHWDLKTHSDKDMVFEFLKEYNSCDMVVGQNNDGFDNRWVQARAMKYNFDLNTKVKSFDLMKMNKRLFRLPSYSMDFVTKFIDVTFKQSHEGKHMWDMIEGGNDSEQEEYIGKMIGYNKGDIVSTEDMYLRNRKYYGHKVHFGVLQGKPKFTCPNCGGCNLELYKSTTTGSGTVQRIMRCKDDGVMFSLNNRQYLNYMEYILNK